MENSTEDVANDNSEELTKNSSGELFKDSTEDTAAVTSEDNAEVITEDTSAVASEDNAEVITKDSTGDVADNSVRNGSSRYYRALWKHAGNVVLRVSLQPFPLSPLPRAWMLY